MSECVRSAAGDPEGVPATFVMVEIEDGVDLFSTVGGLMAETDKSVSRL
jgi:hypothetical protein